MITPETLHYIMRVYPEIPTDGVAKKQYEENCSTPHLKWFWKSRAELLQKLAEKES